MTDIIAPPAPVAVPIYPSLGSPTFNQDAYNYGSSMPGVASSMQGFAGNVHNNALAVHERAGAAASSASAAADAAAAALISKNSAATSAATATTKAGEAVTSAAEAYTSAVNASKINLGAKASAPSVDNQGAALQPGASYYDTTANRWRIWSGSGWVDGYPSGVVSSVAGKTGAVTLVNADVGLGNVDNTSDANKPVSTAQQAALDGKLGATATAAAATKLSAARTLNGVAFDGTANIVIPGNPTVKVATGGVMDCAAGDHFTATVAGNTTLSFSNVPAGSYACVLEVNHTSGTITFPTGTVWAGSAPTLSTGKRHLFFFQRAQVGTAGWYASALPGYST